MTKEQQKFATILASIQKHADVLETLFSRYTEEKAEVVPLHFSSKKKRIAQEAA